MIVLVQKIATGRKTEENSEGGRFYLYVFCDEGRRCEANTHISPIEYRIVGKYSAMFLINIKGVVLCDEDEGAARRLKNKNEMRILWWSSLEQQE